MGRADRDHVLRLLGGRPGTIRFGAPEIVGEAAVRGIALQHLRFPGSHGEAVPGVFLPPATTGAPAVLYCHAHGGAYDVGTRELAEGRPALAGPWLDDLAALGWAVLCLEMPTFGSRAEPAEGPLSKALLWRGETLFGRMLAELRAGMDWLSAHPGIDAARIATMGVSMGGLHASWLAALDSRFAAVVSLCCLGDIGTLIALGNHDRHGHYLTVPGFAAHTTTGDFVALTAPRPMFVGVGMQDWSSPPVAFAPVRAALEAAYDAAGAAGALRIHVEPDTGHAETPAMRAGARDFLMNALS